MLIQSSSDLTNQLLSKFGPTIGGQDLYVSLGFKTYAAFHRSRRREALGVHVFKLPGRRSWFALTGDIATWLEKQSAAQG